MSNDDLGDQKIASSRLSHFIFLLQLSNKGFTGFSLRDILILFSPTEYMCEKREKRIHKINFVYLQLVQKIFCESLAFCLSTISAENSNLRRSKMTCRFENIKLNTHITNYFYDLVGTS